MLAFSVPAAIPGQGGRAHLPRGHAAPVLRAHRLQGRWPSTRAWPSIFSELEDQNFTGIGISCGGGMCNVTLAYLSIPSIMFSIAKGGDFIDRVGGRGGQRARHAGEGASRRRASTSPAPPRTSSRRRSHIYYEDLVETLVEALRKAISPRRRSCPRRTAPCPSCSPAAPPSRGASRSCSSARCKRALAAHRDLRGAHGHGSAHRHRARRADRRDVREVAGPTTVPVGPPVARRPARRDLPPSRPLLAFLLSWPRPRARPASGTTTTWTPATGSSPPATARRPSRARRRPSA